MATEIITNLDKILQKISKMLGKRFFLTKRSNRKKDIHKLLIQENRIPKA